MSVLSVHMLRRSPGVLLAVAVALAAAGVTVVVLQSTGGGGPPSDPRTAVVDALAKRPRDVAGSARYVVRYAQEAISVGVGATVTYEGSADLEGQRFLARARIVPQGDEPPQEYDSFVLQPPPRTFDVRAPEIDERCPADRPRSGTLTLLEAVMYQESFYVRLHLRFS